MEASHDARTDTSSWCWVGFRFLWIFRILYCFGGRWMHVPFSLLDSDIGPPLANSFHGGSPAAHIPWVGCICLEMNYTNFALAIIVGKRWILALAYLRSRSKRDFLPSCIDLHSWFPASQTHMQWSLSISSFALKLMVHLHGKLFDGLLVVVMCDREFVGFISSAAKALLLPGRWLLFLYTHWHSVWFCTRCDSYLLASYFTGNWNFKQSDDRMSQKCFRDEIWDFNRKVSSCKWEIINTKVLVTIGAGACNILVAYESHKT